MKLDIGWSYAFDPQHPLRGDQAFERLRWRNLDMAWDRGSSGRWTCEREQSFANDAERERAYELAQQRWAECGLVECDRAIDVAIHCSAREPRLEQEIRASEAPDAALAVHADWLQHQSDPRGIIAALDLARQRATDPNERERLQQAFQVALVEHGAHAFGPYAEHREHMQLEWSGGMVVGLSFDGSELPPSDSRNFMDRLSVSELLELPIFACLRELRLPGGLGVLSPAHVEHLSGLRLLECSNAANILHRLNFPRLEQLETRTDLRHAVRLPALRRLSLSSLHHVDAGVLRESEFPNLDELTLTPGYMGHRVPTPLAAELVEFLALPLMTRLRRFTLINEHTDRMPWAHDVAEVLLEAASLRSLARVELHAGDFDADARTWLLQQTRARPNWQLE